MSVSMRVMTPAPAAAPGAPDAAPPGRTATFELLGLSIATLVIAAGVFLTLAARALPGLGADLRIDLGVFFGAFWAAHLVRRWRGASDDPILLPAVLLLTGIGLMMMLGLADPIRGGLLARRFAWGAAAGAAALAACASFDVESSPLRRTAAAPLAMAVALAGMLLVLGSGPGASGVKVNLFGVQPVEAIRLLVILALASYFARRIELLRELSPHGMPRTKDIRPVAIAMALVLAFFFLQKDLGPALVLTLVFLGVYGVARGRGVLVVAGVLVLILAFAAAYQLGYPPTVRQRVAIWLDPWSNALPRGDQIAKGLWALGTGGVTGTGAGLGDARLVPAAHTDFVLSAVGEELGFAGVFAVFALYVLLCWRCLRAALRAPGDYSAFVAIGIALGLMVQAWVIAGGLFGLLPLSGVVTPFLSYGRSSMLANCAAIGIVLGIASRRGRVRVHMVGPVRVLGAILLAGGAAIVGRAAWIQIVDKDAIAVAGSLAEQSDHVLRFQYNPRLLAAARLIERGTIYDRNGLPMATSRPAEMTAVADRLSAAGIQAESCAGTPRCYPLGGRAFHLLGDATFETNWAAVNASFLERDRDGWLKGWNDHAHSVEVRNPRTRVLSHAVQRDYRELLPLLRSRYQPDAAAVQALVARDRDLHSSIDARLQMRTASLLEQHVRRGGFAHGAAVILDVETGEVLAAASYPWPDASDLSGGVDQDEAGLADRAGRWLDRPRYGLYPPGSTFKLLVAAAALRSGAAGESFACVRLPDGRVGNVVRGWSRPVRDDPMDTSPHGELDLHRGLVVSCNAYFAQLAVRMGPQPLLDAASLFQIDVSRPATATELRRSLAQAGYGQGEVVVSPVKMARIAATIARQGRVAPARWLREDAPTKIAEPRLLTPADAAILARDMRAVVTSGTGRALAGNPVAIAGKTGTAEVANGRAHSWFAGFAPYGGQRQIAFAVIIENAGYGARAAAPLAGDLVMAARDLGLLR